MYLVFARKKTDSALVINKELHSGIYRLRLEELYSYTEKNQQKRTRKTKQNKGKLCTANNYIQQPY